MIGHRSSRGTARAGAGDAGFTLIEILIATVIMLIVSMGVITALSFSGWATTFTGQRTKALNLANQYIEKARNLPYDDIGTYVDGPVYGDPPGVIHSPDVVGDFTVGTAITWQRDAITGRAKYKNVGVTVTWTRPLQGSVKLYTSIFGKSDLVNTGDLEIMFVDHDTAAPIPGLPITITPQGSTQVRTVSTGASGTAFFGFVPTGRATMVVTTSSWLFDPADVPVINVNAGDVLSSYSVKAQKPSTAVIHVQGTHGDALAGASVHIVGGLGTDNGTTNSSGDVTFNSLILANYTVTASMSGRKTQSGSVAVVAPCGGTANATIVLNDPYLIVYTVMGTSGTGLPGATVNLTTPDGAMTGTTGSDGTVTFSLISTGTIKADATLSPRRPGSRSDLIGGTPWAQTFAFSITLGDPVSVVTVTVTNDAGTAISGVAVVLSGPLGGSGTTDNNGQIVFTNLIAGAYTVTATKSGYAVYTAQPVAVSLAPGDSKTLPIRLDRMGSLQVTATDKTGALLRSIYVRITDANNAATHWDLITGTRTSDTPPRGMTIVQSLPPGTYNINFSPIPPNLPAPAYTADPVVVTVAPNQTGLPVSLQAK
jgi:prepilin-type N-terminal cleavage/methylation domain-containing protein